MTVDGSQVTELETSVSVLRPSNWCETRGGKLIRVNGIERGTIWLGLSEIWPLGITPPAAGPTIALDAAAGGAIVGDYHFAFRYKDADGIFSSLSPLTTKAATAADDGFDWSDITASSETRVTHIELYRSTYAQSRVLYLVATIADGTTTYATDDDDDDTHLLNDALPIRNPDGTLSGRRQGVPPNWKAVCVAHQDRYWYAVDVPLRANTFRDITTWDDVIVGRYLYKIGNTRPLEVMSVATNTLTLDDSSTFVMASTNDDFYTAVIGPGPNERNRVYYSEIDEPESVPTSQNVTELQNNTDDNDEVVGMMPHGATLWVLKDRHCYRLTHIRDPQKDAVPKLAFDRGCINQECWCLLHGQAFLLDQFGIWSPATSGATPLSPPLQDIFRDPTVDWAKSTWFFASSEPNQNVVRFHIKLTTDGGTRPKTAICYSPVSGMWWTETYPIELGGACRIAAGGASRVLVGGNRGKVALLAEGVSDMLVATGKIAKLLATEIVDGTSGLPAAADVADITFTGATNEVSKSTVSALVSRTFTNSGSDWSPVPAAGDTFTISNYAGTHIVTVAAAKRITAAGSTFTSAIVGEVVTMTSGSADTHFRTIDALYASGMTVADTIPAAELGVPSGNQKLYYATQFSLRGDVSSTVAAGNVTFNTITHVLSSSLFDLVGVPVMIVEGEGQGQVRTISSISGTSVIVTEAWTTGLDSTSVYVIGAIRYRYKSGMMDIPMTDQGQQRTLTLEYRPTTGDNKMQFRTYVDHNTDPVSIELPYSESGMLTRTNDGNLVLDMKKARSSYSDATGLVRYRFTGRSSENTVSHRYLTAELIGGQGVEEIVIDGLAIEGVQ